MTLVTHRQDKFKTAPGALLLDLDNTLYPYAPNHERAMRQVRDKAQRLLSIPPSEFDALFDRARREVKDRLGRTAASHSRLLYFQRLIELIGFKTQVLIALDLEQTYWRSFLSGAHLADDALEFLDDMRLRGVPIVIVTDLTAQIQFRKIIHFGLDHYVDYVVTSEEAGADKGHRAPFDLALAKIAPVTPPVWIIGDDPKCDIPEAGVVNGAVVIQRVSSQGSHTHAQVDATFEHFSELRKLLANIQSR